jgi:GMP synthase (glutamine-hydrolysing)
MTQRDMGWERFVFDCHTTQSLSAPLGVLGDGYTYDHACMLRAGTSTDGKTADYYPFDHSFLGHVANRIINEARGTTDQATYDVRSKPPGTIEWE